MIDDELTLCRAELIGGCAPHRYIHDCTHPDGHAPPHECACGRTWIDPDD